MISLSTTSVACIPSHSSHLVYEPPPELPHTTHSYSRHYQHPLLRYPGHHLRHHRRHHLRFEQYNDDSGTTYPRCKYLQVCRNSKTCPIYHVMLAPDRQHLLYIWASWRRIYRWHVHCILFVNMVAKTW